MANRIRNAANKNGGKTKRTSGKVSKFKRAYNLPTSEKKLKGIVSRSRKK